jgi:indole-3-glycerol phosphate synthase
VSVLARILASKERDVAALREHTRPSRGLGRRSQRDLVKTLQRGSAGGLRLIAEVKLRSPSAGALSRALAPEDRAVAYAESGAAMVSVLCDGAFFDGSWDHLSAARQRLDATFPQVPLLAKEFVIDERQVQEARDRGADAVLLIARIVSPARLSELARAARGEGLEPLIEVVDEAELEAADRAGARIVGVNARDLDTLQIDPVRTARVLVSIPPDVVAVHLSGIRGPEEVAQIARGRADAALVGEALMRDDDPRPRLRALLEACN